MMSEPQPPLSNQRMFHGHISANALAGQLAARFNDRQHKTQIENQSSSSLIQIGSKHGTPVTMHIAEIEGGLLVSASRGRDWLDRTADASEVFERAATNPLSLLSILPDVVGEMRKDNLLPEIWTAIDDIMGLTRSLAGEVKAPENPITCPFCGRANPPGSQACDACGGPLPVVLPRVCPKCGRGHTSDALFCQACGTRLITE